MLSQLRQYHPVIELETVAHLLKSEYGDEQERAQLGQLGLQIVNRYDGYECPYKALFEAAVSDSKATISHAAGLHYSSANDESHTNDTDNEHRDDNVMKHLLSGKYLEALALLDANSKMDKSPFKHMEQFAKIMIFSRNYENVQELELRLQYSLSDDRIDQISKDQQSSQNLSDEKESICRIKLYICTSYFIEGRYFECSSKFYKFYIEDPKTMMKILTSKVDGDALLLLPELKTMIAASTLVSIPVNSYDELISIDELTELFDTVDILSRSLKLLINTSFKCFLALWNNEFQKTLSRCYLLNKSWETAERLMKMKIYCFYLKLSKTLTISYLSEKLGIEYDEVKESVERLICSANLYFHLDGDVISYSKRSIVDSTVRTLDENCRHINELLDKQRVRNDKLKEMISGNLLEEEQTIRKSDTAKTSNNQEIMDIDDVQFLSDDLEQVDSCISD